MAVEGFEESGSLMIEIIDQIVQASTGVLMWMSAVIFLVGLAMIIVSYFIKDKPQASEAPAQK